MLQGNGSVRNVFWGPMFSVDGGRDLPGKLVPGDMDYCYRNSEDFRSSHQEGNETVRFGTQPSHLWSIFLMSCGGATRVVVIRHGPCPRSCAQETWNAGFILIVLILTSIVDFVRARDKKGGSLTARAGEASIWNIEDPASHKRASLWRAFGSAFLFCQRTGAMQLTCS